MQALIRVDETVGIEGFVSVTKSFEKALIHHVLALHTVLPELLI